RESKHEFRRPPRNGGSKKKENGRSLNKIGPTEDGIHDSSCPGSVSDPFRTLAGAAPLRDQLPAPNASTRIPSVRSHYRCQHPANRARGLYRFPNSQVAARPLLRRRLREERARLRRPSAGPAAVVDEDR